MQSKELEVIIPKSEELKAKIWNLTHDDSYIQVYYMTEDEIKEKFGE